MSIPRPSRAARKPLLPRDVAEQHRPASALELFFDLCFVVAVSQAARGLHHSFALGHLDVYLVNYCFVFFAIWWAWMNFTWFASAYDNDSVSYRLLVAVQIGGVLIIAAGVPRAFDHRDATVMTIGYVVLRVAQGIQWLRVSRSDHPRRITALRYAGGQLTMQVGWLIALHIPARQYLLFIGVLILLELLVPVWAERAAPTTWHPRHIAERYSLFFLIVLGESVFATTVALQSAIDSNIGIDKLLAVILGGFVTVFSMWWLYFLRPGDEILKPGTIAFRWAYGHYLIFAATAALGAGLEAAIDTVVAANTDHATEQVHAVSETAAHFQVGIPIAIFVTVLAVLHWPDATKHTWQRWQRWQLPVTAALILLSCLLSVAYWVIALLIATTVALKVATSGRKETSHA